jgi:phosphoribosylformylglycinamidine cyclo-ligase
LIGLASSGLHSNGFSLARKVLLEEGRIPLDQMVPGTDQTLGDALLCPTRIYVKSFLALMDRFQVKGGAHITGGGLIENVPRILPDGCHVVMDRTAWDVPPIFRWLKECGNLTEEDMFRTFNMGIGMVVVVPEEEAEAALQVARDLGETAWVIGEVTEGERGLSWMGGV